MVLCFVALFVFAVLGIFSAKYRALAGEAFDCVIRTATFRPCESKLDERLKATILVHVITFSPSMAGSLNKHFRFISFFFTALFFASMFYTAYASYNYAVYGHCDGPQGTGFCPFDLVFGDNTPDEVIPIIPGVGPVRGSGEIVLVEVGCFTCPYTKQTQPALKEFLSRHPEISLEFRVLPLPAHENSLDAAKASFCALEQNNYWAYHDALFELNDRSPESLIAVARKMGMDESAFRSCMGNEQTAQRVQLDKDAATTAGVYGTPTFFLNGIVMVGPQTLQQFEDALAGNPSNQNVPPGSCPPPPSVS
ncbi:thioredoxin domain-containing protein [Candidatus Micrarchaeota archaeon]|nr:thioredoxin domain-containing protein [Candidatus Micrarchaeota archaeon]